MQGEENQFAITWHSSKKEKKKPLPIQRQVEDKETARDDPLMLQI